MEPYGSKYGDFRNFGVPIILLDGCLNIFYANFQRPNPYLFRKFTFPQKTRESKKSSGSLGLFKIQSAGGGGGTVMYIYTLGAKMSNKNISKETFRTSQISTKLQKTAKSLKGHF